MINPDIIPYLSGSDLSYACLIGANLRDAGLNGTDLRRANLSRANLRDADLSDTDLRDAGFSGADLRYADLRYADLSGANLHDANLYSADLTYATLPETDIFIACPWSVCHIRSDSIRIGCENHTVEEWRSFSDEDILAMDGEKALIWWRQNRERVLYLAESL